MDQWMVSATSAAKMLGVSTRTLRRYTQQGVLTDRRSPGGRRVFSLLELEAVRKQRGKLAPSEGVVLYGRVSSQRQRAQGDLDRQMTRLRQAARVGSWWRSSGMCPRGCPTSARGLRRALQACQRPQVSVLLIEHEQQLARCRVAVIRDVMVPAFGV